MNTGMAGMKVMDSEICKLDHDLKTIFYRGYDLKDLAEFASFEEVVYLLIAKKLPNAGELAKFHQTLFENFVSAKQGNKKELTDVLSLVPSGAHPMDILKFFVSFLGMKKDTTNDLLTLVGGTVSKLSSACGFINSNEFAMPASNLTFTENTLLNVRYNNSGPLTPLAIKAFEASLILYMEHELPASTFAARVTASTLSDYFSGIATGIGTLKGNLHGGANEAVMHMLAAVGKPEKAKEWVKDALNKKKKIMGFGHRVYKKGDPRSPIVESYSKKLSEECKDAKFYEISKIIEETILEEKGLYPNLDFYTASIYNLLGIPTELFTPIFVLTRSAGWSAHILEQWKNNKLIRPGAEYVGPEKKKWIDVKNR